jgi:nucleoside-diphosphate-sugar epimerase
MVADVNDPATLASLPSFQRVLFAVGYDGQSERSIEEVYGVGLQNVLAALGADADRRFAMQRLVYISSTGVYAQTGDQWVDEDSPCLPTRPGGRAALAAERALARHPLGAKGVILRLAGIYGPGRIPYLDLLESGRPIPAPRHGYLNLIHIDDAAKITIQALTTKIDPSPFGRGGQGEGAASGDAASGSALTPTHSQGKREKVLRFASGPRTYCVSDGHPVLREDYYAEISRLIGAPPPRFQPVADTPAAARAASSKRVSNARLMADLPVKLVYSSYREGLTAILGAQAGPLPESSLPP